MELTRGMITSRTYVVFKNGEYYDEVETAVELSKIFGFPESQTRGLARVVQDNFEVINLKKDNPNKKGKKYLLKQDGKELGRFSSNREMIDFTNVHGNFIYYTKMTEKGFDMIYRETPYLYECYENGHMVGIFTAHEAVNNLGLSPYQLARSLKSDYFLNYLLTDEVPEIPKGDHKRYYEKTQYHLYENGKLDKTYDTMADLAADLSMLGVYVDNTDVGGAMRVENKGIKLVEVDEDSHGYYRFVDVYKDNKLIGRKLSLKKAAKLVGLSPNNIGAAANFQKHNISVKKKVFGIEYECTDQDGNLIDIGTKDYLQENYDLLDLSFREVLSTRPIYKTYMSFLEEEELNEQET